MKVSEVWTKQIERHRRDRTMSCFMYELCYKKLVSSLRRWAQEESSILIQIDDGPFSIYKGFKWSWPCLGQNEKGWSSPSPPTSAFWGQSKKCFKREELKDGFTNRKVGHICVFLVSFETKLSQIWDSLSQCGIEFRIVWVFKTIVSKTWIFLR